MVDNASVADAVVTEDEQPQLLGRIAIEQVPTGPSPQASTNSSPSSPPVSPNAAGKRKPRAMSLTSTLASKTHPIVPNEDEVPPLPEFLRKQKSVKKFFFSTDALPLEQDKKPRGLLSRAKSKPSLRIDVKASKENPVPALATASSSGQSDGLPDTPSSRTFEAAHRGLSKRFSLSNMSAAFKKKATSAGSVVPIPTVPELPEAYRREKHSRVKESAVPLSSIVRSASQSRQEERNPSPPEQTHTSNTHSIDGDSDISSAFGLDDSDGESDIEHAELMHVSPRTRRNPSTSLQQYLGTAPAPQTGVMVVPNSSRMSVEGVIFGPLLIPEGVELGAVIGGGEQNALAEENARSYPLKSGSGDSIESLSRSSSTSEPDESEHQPLTPNIISLNPLSPPLDIPDAAPTPSFGELAPIETPPPQSNSSSPRLRNFESPKAFMRMLSSPLSSRTVPVPPSAPPSPAESTYSSLCGDVQLKSLHFDSLGLDFDGFP